MGVDSSFEIAYYKAQLAANTWLPTEGTIFVSVKDDEIANIVPEIEELQKLQFKIKTDARVKCMLEGYGIYSDNIFKTDNDNLHMMFKEMSSDVDMIINTNNDKNAKSDDTMIRLVAIDFNIPYITTISGFKATVRSMIEAKKQVLGVKALQELEVR
jgi:carbamoyl-phosphate synthase large subunit